MEMSDELYTVGTVGAGAPIAQFSTEHQAAAYISTLPDYEQGIYYLDAPAAQGEV